MSRRGRVVAASQMWLALVVVAGAMATGPRTAMSQESPLDLDATWFGSLACAESLMAHTPAGGNVDSTGRAAVVEQIRIGAHVLGALLQASVSADTLLAAPLIARPPAPPPRRWSSRLRGITRVISASASLAHLVASLSGTGAGVRRGLAYVGGSAATIGGLFEATGRRAPPPGTPDASDRAHLVGLEADLRGAVFETERAAELLWVDLRVMILDSCATDEQAVLLARRYAIALERASMVLGHRVAGAAASARSCADHPGFDDATRERLAMLAAHLETIGGGWHERRWLFERSERNALDYLVRVDRAVRFAPRDEG